MVAETSPTVERADLSPYLGRVIQGDCLDVMRGLPDGCVDAVVTDPPYFGREDLFPVDATFAALDGYTKTVPCVVFWPALGRIPFRDPDAIHIWHKAIPIHPNSKIGNTRGHQYERILTYSCGTSCKVAREAAIIPGFAACADECVAHPTQKPLALMRWLVRLACPPGGTVLDPFAGSGTTAVACIAEDRQFICIEREAEYVAIAEKRIAQARRAYQPALAL